MSSYDWLYQRQHLRYYPRASQDISIQGSFREWDSVRNEWLYTNRFGDTEVSFEQFAKQQRVYFQKFCRLMANLGDKPWVLFDYDSGSVNINGKSYPSGNRLTYADGVDGPGPVTPKSLGEWRYLKDSDRKIYLYTLEQTLREYDGEAVWPFILDYRGTIRPPPGVDCNLVGRQAYLRGGSGSRDMLISPPRLTDRWYIQENGSLDANISSAFSVYLGNVETAEYEAGKTTKWIVNINGGFEILHYRSDKNPDGFDPTDWLVSVNQPNAFGYNVQSIKVVNNRAIIETSAYSGAPNQIGNAIFLNFKQDIVTSGVYQLPKFRLDANNNVINKYDVTTPVASETYTYNKGDPFYFTIAQGDLPSPQNQEAWILRGKHILLLTANGKKYSVAVSVSGTNLYVEFPSMVLELFSNLNEGLPDKIEIEQFESYYAGLAKIDPSNTTFASVQFVNERWSINKTMNWYDDLWLTHLKEDLETVFTYERRNKVVVNGQIHVHDHVRVTVDGEFNEQNRIFTKRLYDRDNNEIDIQYIDSSNRVIDVDWNYYHFTTVSSSYFQASWNDIQATYSGWDGLFGSRFYKEDVGGTPLIPGQTVTAWSEVSTLTEGYDRNPSNGNTTGYSLWPGSVNFQQFVKNSGDSGDDYLPAYEPAKIGNYTYNRNYGTGNTFHWVESNDHKTIQMSANALLDIRGYIIADFTFLNFEDATTGASSIEATWYCSDLPEGWINSSNKDAVTTFDVVYEYRSDKAGGGFYVVRGRDVITASTNTINTWNPPSSYGTDPELIAFGPYPRLLHEMSAATTDSSTRSSAAFNTTSIYENYHFNSDIDWLAGLRTTYDNYTNAWLRCTYGDLRLSLAQEDLVKADFLSPRVPKPFIQVYSANGNTRQEALNSCVHKSRFSLGSTWDRLIAWACVPNDTLYFRSEADVLIDGGVHSEDKANLSKVDHEYSWSIESGITTPFIDEVWLPTEGNHAIGAIVYALPRTQLYITVLDTDTWDSIESRIQVWGYGGSSSAISGWDLPQFTQHEFSFSSGVLTIENSPSNTIADYSWSFDMIKPTIDTSNYQNDRYIIIDIGDMEQYCKIFASTTDNAWFDGRFDNEIEAIKTDDGKYRIDIPYEAGTIYRVYIWDTVMSVSVRSVEYTSIGTIPVIGDPGDSSAPSPLTPDPGGIVDV